jgi:hypothetical protein
VRFRALLADSCSASLLTDCRTACSSLQEYRSTVQHTGNHIKSLSDKCTHCIICYLLQFILKIVQHVSNYVSSSSGTQFFITPAIDVKCRSQCPRGLRRGSTAARLLGLRVRIPPGAWMSVCCECCVLSGRGLCDGLVPSPDESYRVWCV